MTAEISLSRGLVAIVDDTDADWLRQWKWHASRMRNGQFRAARKDKAVGTVMMHRQIMGVLGQSVMIDHANCDPLDNRRSNLRICSNQQNQWNRRKDVDGRNPYKGVYPRDGRFIVLIKVDGRHKCLGRFDSAEEARATYIAAAIEHFGEFARAG